MNAKKLKASTELTSPKKSHIRLMSVVCTIGLLASQSVYAADGSSSSGIPGWIWGLVAIAILVGITLLPKKWVDPNQAKTLEKKTPPQAPIAKTVETPQTIQAEVPKVEAAPVVEMPVEVAPVEKPTAVEAPQEVFQEAPQPEKAVEAIDALDEAKQLLAQQRFPQAVGILNKGLQKNPERSDLMLELLTIYLKQNDHEAFDAQWEQLKQLDDPLALIQAEELHAQLERPTVKDKALSAEQSDSIDFAATPITIPEPETPQPTSIGSFDDSLTFTSEKPAATTEITEAKPESQTHDAESASLGKTVDITPIENEFSLDDFNFEQPTVETKETPVEVSAEKPSDDFDFSDFDDFVISAPSETKSLDTTPKETAPTVPEAKEAEPLTPAAELVDLKVPTAESSQASDLVDLEFDLDDSFTSDDDKVETTAKKAGWTTDLADETFASPTEPAFKDPFASEVAPEPVVPVPVAPPKVVEPVAKDLATTLEEEFPFLQTADTFQTRLDLARNYIALGEISSAKELLNEVVAQGAGTQQAEARDLIAKLAS